MGSYGMEKMYMYIYVNSPYDEKQESNPYNIKVLVIFDEAGISDYVVKQYFAKNDRSLNTFKMVEYQENFFSSGFKENVTEWKIVQCLYVSSPCA